MGSELRRVDARLPDELHSDHAQANEVIRHGIRLSRQAAPPCPACSWPARPSDRLRDEHITLAAVVEMIHTATLVHDDVLDEAAIRRHDDTVNARWNNETSVLLGDFLFTHAFYLASTLESTYACRTIGQATNIVCDGELRQTHLQRRREPHRGRLPRHRRRQDRRALRLLPANWAPTTPAATRRRSPASPPSAATSASPSRSPTICSTSKATKTATGKSLGTDLAKRKMTLPLIHARESLDPHDRKRFLAALVADPATARDSATHLARPPRFAQLRPHPGAALRRPSPSGPRHSCRFPGQRRALGPQPSSPSPGGDDSSTDWSLQRPAPPNCTRRRSDTRRAIFAHAPIL